MMTIEERTNDIIESLKKTKMYNISKIRTMIDEYVSIYNDNKVLHEVFLDPSVMHFCYEEEIRSYHFICYLRTLINFGNRLNLPDDTFFSDFTIANDLLHTCVRKVDRFGKFETHILSDSKLFNDLYWLYNGLEINDDIPDIFKFFIIIIMYKNVISIGYGEEDYDSIFEKMRDLYKKMLNDDFILEYIEHNNLDDDFNLFMMNNYDLLSFIKEYFDDTIKYGKRRVIIE